MYLHSVVRASRRHRCFVPFSLFEVNSSVLGNRVASIGHSEADKHTSSPLLVTSSHYAYVVWVFTCMWPFCQKHMALFTKKHMACLCHMSPFAHAQRTYFRKQQTARGDSEWINTPLLSSHLLADQRREHTKNHGGQSCEYLVIILIQVCSKINCAVSLKLPLKCRRNVPAYHEKCSWFSRSGSVGAAIP